MNSYTTESLEKCPAYSKQASFKHISFSFEHFAMSRNTESLICALGTNSVLQVNYTSKKQTNLQKDQICDSEVGGKEEVLEEDGQKVQTSSYKVNKYQ